VNRVARRAAARGALAAALTLALLLGAPPVTLPRAAAHAIVLESVPARDAVLDRAPERVILRFNSKIEKRLSRITLAVSTLQTLLSGSAAMQTAQSADAKRILAPVPSIEHPTETGIILVVDDNLSNREMLERRLTRDGHQILLAAGGDQALALLREQRVDVKRT